MVLYIDIMLKISCGYYNPPNVLLYSEIDVLVKNLISIKKNGSIVDLQCYVSFCFTAK